MKAISEIHVVPVWNEYDRVLEPIARHRPNIVYLLEDESADLPPYYDDLHREIAALGTDLRLVSVDLFDMYAVMGCVTTLVDSHTAEDTVRVNVTCGTKQAAIGATMACMDEGTDALPYCVNETDPVPDATRPADRSFEEASSIDIYPIDSPTHDQLAGLAIVEACNTASRRTKFRTIIDKGTELDLACFRGTTNDKALYGKLRNHVVGPLEQKAYIEVDVASSRSKYVEVTDAGLQTLRAFRHRVEDVISQLASESTPSVQLELEDPTESVERWDTGGAVESE